MDSSWGGMLTVPPPKSTTNAWAKPKSRQASTDPWGVHLPKITAAKAINPWPLITVGEKMETTAKLCAAPPNPANTPERITAMYRMR